MTDAFAWVIAAYGQTMVCYDKEGVEQGGGMAIVQPMTAGALGSYRTDRFLCLAVPTLPLGRNGWVTWGGSRYEVMTVRPVWVGGKTTHLWMVLRPAEEAAV